MSDELVDIDRWNNTYTTGTGRTIQNVHLREHCIGYCPIHHPSDHHMQHWPTNWIGHRSDVANGYMQRICEHGVGHPDPDEIHKPEGHDCDGCCNPHFAAGGYVPDSGHSWPY